MRVILASASPRRADLLRAAGFSFAVRAVEVDERVLEGEEPRAYVQRLAVEKARRAFESLGPAEAGHHDGRGDGIDSDAVSGLSRTARDAPEVLVIGADTAVVVDDRILGKPSNSADAERMLSLLSGRSHVVITGVSVQTASNCAVGTDETRVFFASLTPEQVAWYVHSGEGLDKAGAYGIQGLASRFIPRIEGSYSNVVGLPVAVLDALIREVTGGPHVLASVR